MKEEKNQKTEKQKTGWKKFWIIIGLILLFLAGIAIGMFYDCGKARVKKVTSHEVVGCVKSNNGIAKGGLADTINKHVVKEKRKLSKETCTAIEELLTKKLNSFDEFSDGPHVHVDRAQYYVRLSERGCPENREKYKELAIREIDIARALADDRFYEVYEIVDVVETYKKLDMKREAEVVFEKVKKMTDPAIDFILQIEKVINE